MPTQNTRNFLYDTFFLKIYKKKNFFIFSLVFSFFLLLLMKWKFWKILNYLNGHFLKLNLLGIFGFSTYLLSLPFNSISFAFIDLLTFCLAQFSLFSFGSSAHKKNLRKTFSHFRFGGLNLSNFFGRFLMFRLFTCYKFNFSLFFSSIKKTNIF